MKYLPIILCAILAACGGGGDSKPASVPSPIAVAPTPQPVLPPIPAKGTSYTNAKEMGLEPIRLHDRSATAYARADFQQNGKMSVFVASLTYDVGKPISSATPGRFGFFRIENNALIPESNMIDSTVGCMHPRKAIVADFNNDRIPDVAVACQGYDAPPFPGEHMRILLSTAGGKYRSLPILSMGEGFFHAATAADFNNDGNVDMIVTDDVSGGRKTLRMFLGNGDGSFVEKKDMFPTFINEKLYFTVDAMDVNGDGKLDVVAGGHEWQGDSNPIILTGNGTENFANANITVLPAIVDHGVILDFLHHNNALYIARTGGGGTIPFYGSKVIQKVDLSTQQSSVLYTSLGDWFAWLTKSTRGIESDNLDHPTPPVQ